MLPTDTTADLTASVNALWLLFAASLVLLAAVGVLVFYAGFGRHVRWADTIRAGLASMALVGALWVAFGYSMAFGTTGAGASADYGPPALIPHVLGNPLSNLVLSNLGQGMTFTARESAYAGFEGAIAMLAMAIVAGAVAYRIRFGSWMLFAGLWATVVYFPISYWVLNYSDGWVQSVFQAHDFAGASAVHITAGATVLAVSLLLHRRPAEPIQPPAEGRNLIGVGLFWLGWFGVTAGAEAALDDLTATVWLNTLTASCTAILGWLLIERITMGRSTATGAACGALSGLVAISAGCDLLTPVWAALLGALAGVLGALCLAYARRWGTGISNIVVCVHLIGGSIGMIWVGLFATDTGLAYTGSLIDLGVQAVAILAVGGYAFLASMLLAWIVNKTARLRVGD